VQPPSSPLELDESQPDLQLQCLIGALEAGTVGGRHQGGVEGDVRVNRLTPRGLFTQGLEAQSQTTRASSWPGDPPLALAPAFSPTPTESSWSISSISADGGTVRLTA
jgi:hypothetical protein